MKLRVLILLAVLVLAAMSGIGLAAAQGATTIQAMVVDGATLYAEPSDAAEVVAELSDGDLLSVLATDPSGAWLEVEGDAGAGYVMLDSVMVLELPMLAPKVYVMSEAGTGLSVADGQVTAMPFGTVGTVLAVDGENAYLDVDGARGWSPVSAWEDASAIEQGVYTENAAGGVAIYDSPKLNASPIATVPPGMSVYTVAEADDTYSTVYVPGLGLGYVQTKNLGDPGLPGFYVEVSTENAAGGVALYDAPKLNAEPVAIADPGSVLMWVETVDDTYAKVYGPAYGEVYVQAKNLSNPFTVATVQEADAVLRVGPNDNLYDAVALLPAGTQGVIMGKTDNGAWVQVAVPFAEVDFGYNGVSGWMRDYLFTDANGESDLQVDMLAVTGDSN